MTIAIQKNPEFFQNPYPYYEQIRESKTPFFLPHNQQSTSQGVWLFANYAEALEIFRAGSEISKNLSAVRPAGIKQLFDLHLLHRDGKDHLRLRRMVADYFSLQAIQKLEAHIECVAEALIDDFKQYGVIDLVDEFAERLPIKVISRIVGVPEHYSPQIRLWSRFLADSFDSVKANEETAQKQAYALHEFTALARSLIAQKKSAPEDDLLSFLVAKQDDEISEDEVLAMTIFLIFSGHETTISLIGNTLGLLLKHPDQLHDLCGDLSLINATIEESLRFESPDQRTSFRITSESLEICGHQLMAGQQVGILVGAVNRDPLIFKQANRFDIRRTENPHLAFGIGIHHCLGKTLARTEARIGLRCLLQRFPNMLALRERLLWRENSFFRSLENLEVRFT
jgi:cytochrome P450